MEEIPAGGPRSTAAHEYAGPAPGASNLGGASSFGKSLQYKDNYRRPGG